MEELLGVKKEKFWMKKTSFFNFLRKKIYLIIKKIISTLLLSDATLIKQKH